MRSIALLFLTLAFMNSQSAFAQDRQGNDTPGEWIVDHFETFDIWVSSCDYRPTTDGKREERCYLRYVDVYAQEPFGAAFVFVFQKDRQTAFQFSIERNATITPEGLRIESKDGQTSLPETCRIEPGCILEGSDIVQPLLTAMGNGDAFTVFFSTENGRSHKLNWPLRGFQEALADYRKQSGMRGLLSQD